MPASRVDAMNMQDRCLISMQIFQLQLFCTLVVDCGKFPTLLNGKIHSHGTTYQSVVKFTCQDGYKLDGPSSALCLANGSWSAEIPKCTGKPFEFALYEMHRKRIGRGPLNFAGLSEYKVVTSSVNGRFQA
jgi:hypothetical protein